MKGFTERWRMTTIARPCKLVLKNRFGVFQSIIFGTPAFSQSNAFVTVNLIEDDFETNIHNILKAWRSCERTSDFDPAASPLGGRYSL